MQHPKTRATKPPTMSSIDAGEPGGGDDDDVPEKPAARARYFPSSIGVSVLVPASAKDFEDTRFMGRLPASAPSPPNSGNVLHVKRWSRLNWRKPLRSQLRRGSQQAAVSKSPTSHEQSGSLPRMRASPPMLEQFRYSWLIGGRRSRTSRKTKHSPFKSNLRSPATLTSCLARIYAVSPAGVGRTCVRSSIRDIGEYSVGHNVATDAVLDGKKCCMLFEPVGFRRQKWSAWNLHRSKMSSCEWMHLQL